ncbi:MAG: Hsp20/alpha crystallin family protein [Myxococcota bacterium]
MKTNLQTREATLPERAEGTRDRRIVAPRADIHENGDVITLWADMPGVDEAHVNITLDKDVLTIQGTSVEDELTNHAVSYREYAERDFRRSFSLSSEIDRTKISATVRDGVLKLVLPKSEPAKARRIEVKAG